MGRKLIPVLVCVMVIVAVVGIIAVDKIKTKKDKEAYADETVTEATTEETTTEVTTTEEVTTESEEEILDRKISEMVDEMSVSAKVGQMFMIRAESCYSEDILANYQPGGIILFGNDVENKTYDGVQDYIDFFQRNSDVPVFVGIDEEGGTVTRVSYNSNLVTEKFKSPRRLYDEGGMEAVVEDSHFKSKLLWDLGVNVNFAPVCDFSVNPGEFMYDRAFGSTIDETCDFTEQVVTAMKEDKMGSVLKHFPGYGSNGDTHTNIIRDDRSLEEFRTQDFLPFKSGIDAGADFVLVSHNIVESMDPDWPASLSANVHKILREELGFEGVIITDDLAMAGVADYVDSGSAAVQAIKAGNDMMIVYDYQTQYEACLEAVKSGEISEKQIDESVKRIIKAKYDLGIIKIDLD